WQFDFVLAAFGIRLRSGNNHQSCGHKFVDSSSECSGHRESSERSHESGFGRGEILSVEKVASGGSLDPTQLFAQRDRLPWFWFFFTVAVLLLSAIDRYHIVSQFKQRERVVIIDPAGTCYLSPLLQFSEAKDLHIQQAELATMAWHYVFALFRSPASTAAPNAPVNCGCGGTRTEQARTSSSARAMPPCNATPPVK